MTERVSADGRAIVLQLDGWLTPGRYRVSLAANTCMIAESGELLIGDEIPAQLAEFSVSEPVAGPFAPATAREEETPRGSKLEEAAALALVAARPEAISGSLDPSAPGTAARLYRVDLPPGGWHRLGLEVRATRDGSTLNPALALFDGNGRLIEQAYGARLDSPDDPFLFRTLAPGTYYIAVTSEEGRPDLGGYDPTTGWLPRFSGDPASAGAFTLDIVADPVESPTTLVSVAIDRADPASQTATGLTLGFDGPMRTTGAGIELVDAAGRVWTARAAGYDEATGSLRFVLDEAMPAGAYSLRSSGTDPLLDLGGLPIVSAAGGEKLATVVLGAPATLAPGDLGALFPGAASRGVATDLQLDAEGAASGRFVVTVPGQYALSLRGPMGAFRLVGPDGNAVNLPGELDLFGPNGVTVDLAEGEYRFVVSGSQPGDSIVLGVKCLTVHHDDLLTNGLGQSPAFQLRTIAPLGGAGTAVAPAPGSPVLENPMPAPGGETGGGENLPGAIGTESSWLGGLMGRPADPANAEAATASRFGGEPGRLAADGPAVSPAQGGLASAGDAGVFWSINASPGEQGAVASPTAPVRPGDTALSTAPDSSESADEGLAEVASLEEAWADQVLAFLALSEPGEAGGTFLAEAMPNPERGTTRTEDSIGLGDYRLGLGVALVTAWGVRQQLRRRRSTESRGRGRASATSLTRHLPSGPRWSFGRNRAALPRPRLS